MDKNPTYKRGKSKIAPNLFTPEAVGADTLRIKEYLEILNLPTVTHEQNNHLVQPMAEMEILKVTPKGKTRSSSGSDGFTHELEFRYPVSLILCGVFNEILQTGNWPDIWS